MEGAQGKDGAFLTELRAAIGWAFFPPALHASDGVRGRGESPDSDSDFAHQKGNRQIEQAMGAAKWETAPFLTSSPAPLFSLKLLH